MSSTEAPHSLRDRLRNSYRARFSQHPITSVAMLICSACMAIGAVPVIGQAVAGIALLVVFFWSAIWQLRMSFKVPKHLQLPAWMFAGAAIMMIINSGTWSVVLATNGAAPSMLTPWVLVTLASHISGYAAILNLITRGRTDFWRRLLDVFTIGCGLTLISWIGVQVFPSIRVQLQHPGLQSAGLWDEVFMLMGLFNTVVVCIAALRDNRHRACGSIGPAVGWLATSTSLITLCALFIHLGGPQDTAPVSLLLAGGHLGAIWAMMGADDFTSPEASPRNDLHPYIPNVALALAALLATIQGVLYPRFDFVTSLLLGYMVLLMLVRNYVSNKANQSLLRQLQQHQDRLSRQAYTDDLTGLNNRRKFMEQLEHCLDNSQDRAVRVMYLDVDRFKTINDTYGHAVGDQVLIGVAHRLQECLASSESVARLAGDEFAAILPPGEPVEECLQLCIATIREPIRLEHVTIYPTVSIGVATCLPADAERCPDVLMKQADDALYRVKADGRDGYQYQPPPGSVDALADSVVDTTTIAVSRLDTGLSPSDTSLPSDEPQGTTDTTP